MDGQKWGPGNGASSIEDERFWDGGAGGDCEGDVDEGLSDPCQNEGVCRDEADGYSCQCPAGFEGDHCELDVSVCNGTAAGSHCLNGGRCTDGPGLNFTCHCQPGERPSASKVSQRPRRAGFCGARAV